MRRAKIAASRLVSRRGLLQATVGAAAAASATRLPSSPALAASVAASDPLLRALDEKIEAGMARYHIPGVAVGVLYQGREHVRGYGVTNVDYPQPVDGDTLFRIGSTTKTFTGTVVMRLVEQGKLDLNAPVRRYLPGLQLADESVAARVTVRQLLNHSAGWLGDDLAGTARGGDALAKYVAAMQQLPQLTPLGQVFALQQRRGEPGRLSRRDGGGPAIRAGRPGLVARSAGADAHRLLHRHAGRLQPGGVAQSSMTAR